jgi:prenyltransferase beta subunit
MPSPSEDRAAEITARTLRSHALADGGAGARSADLRATYAAVRTLKWIDRLPDETTREETIASLLARRNNDGAFAWQRGLASDVWATFYSAQCLSDLRGQADVEPMLDWLSRTQNADGGFGMQPGQTSDVWATYYAARLFREIGGRSVPDPAALARWLGRLQCHDGGLTWSPNRADPDVRAAYYAVHAALAAELPTEFWDEAALLAWLPAMQVDGGGFRFDAASAPCLWATFRATKTLEALGAEPIDPVGCIAWIRHQAGPDGFTRWPDYPRSDVWANFTAAGALIALGAPPTAAEKDLITASLEGCRTAGGGYTYCDTEHASDALTTASLSIAGQLCGQLDASAARRLVDWLRAAHMPWEDGVMYMPGRGAEIRCTLWALAAQQLSGSQGLSTDDQHRLTRWIAHLQNADGGFGYWVGRGSDVASTAAAVAILDLLRRPVADVIRADAVADFLASCADERGVAPVPGGQVSTNATAQVALTWIALGHPSRARHLVDLLAGHELLSGYRDQADQPPNLYTTYQCWLAFEASGDPGRLPRLSRFLDRLVSADGRIGWTMFGADKQDPLALALYALLARKAHDPVFVLPTLIL